MPGETGKKPAAWHECRKDVRQQHACLAPEETALGVKRNEAVEAGDIEQRPIVIEATVAVAAAIRVGEHAANRGAKIGEGVSPPQGECRARRDLWVVPPG